MKKKGFTPEQIFMTLFETKVLIETWRREYNAIRPHSSLGHKPPAPEAVVPNTGCAHMVGNLTLKVVQ
jgi:putative transposase